MKIAFNATFYPTPSSEDNTDLLTIFQFINTASSELFFPIMILVVWSVMVISTISEGRRASNAFLYASFSSTILSVILGILALMAQKWIYLLILITSFSIFWIKLVNTRE